MAAPAYGDAVGWEPAKPRLCPLRLAVAWVVTAASLYLAAGLVGGVSLESPGGAFLVAGAIGVVNAFLPPLLAALRLPFTLLLGFLLVLFADAAALLVAADLLPALVSVDGFRVALLTALVMAAISIVLQVLSATNSRDQSGFFLLPRCS